MLAGSFLWQRLSSMMVVKAVGLPLFLQAPSWFGQDRAIAVSLS